jgi:hypothetical protein
LVRSIAKDTARARPRDACWRERERENLLVISQNTLVKKGSKIQMVKAYEGSPTAATPVTRPVSWGERTTTALLLARRRKCPDE